MEIAYIKLVDYINVVGPVYLKWRQPLQKLMAEITDSKRVNLMHAVETMYVRQPDKLQKEPIAN